MKRSWFITILLVLVLLGGGVAVLLLPQVVPANQCSAIYQKYAAMEGVDATFIKDYKVNDTVPVDVILLKATMDSAWKSLEEEFNAQRPSDMPPPPPNTVDMRYAPHGNYALPMDPVLANNDIVAISYDDKTIAVFQIESEKQISAIFYYQITLNKKTLKND